MVAPLVVPTRLSRRAYAFPTTEGKAQCAHYALIQTQVPVGFFLLYETPTNSGYP